MLSSNNVKQSNLKLWAKSSILESDLFLELIINQPELPSHFFLFFTHVRWCVFVKFLECVTDYWTNLDLVVLFNLKMHFDVLNSFARLVYVL